MSNTIGSAVRTIWWLVLVRGILLVLLGIFALWSPVLAVWVIVVAFGVYAIVDGIFVIVASITSRKSYPSWGWLLAQGILQIVAGILVLSLPGFVGVFGVFVLLWFIVFSAIVGGIMTIVAASQSSGSDKAWGITGGIVDIVFGVLLGVVAWLNPAGAGLALVWIIAIAAIVFGIILIVLAFRVRKGVTGIADRLDEALGTSA